MRRLLYEAGIPSMCVAIGLFAGMLTQKRSAFSSKQVADRLDACEEQAKAVHMATASTWTPEQTITVTSSSTKLCTSPEGKDPATNGSLGCVDGETK